MSLKESILEGERNENEKDEEIILKWNDDIIDMNKNNEENEWNYDKFYEWEMLLKKDELNFEYIELEN